MRYRYTYREMDNPKGRMYAFFHPRLILTEPQLVELEIDAIQNGIGYLRFDSIMDPEATTVVAVVYFFSYN